MNSQKKGHGANQTTRTDICPKANWNGNRPRCLKAQNIAPTGGGEGKDSKGDPQCARLSRKADQKRGQNRWRKDEKIEEMIPSKPGQLNKKD